MMKIVFKYKQKFSKNYMHANTIEGYEKVISDILSVPHSHYQLADFKEMKIKILRDCKEAINQLKKTNQFDKYVLSKKRSRTHNSKQKVTISKTSYKKQKNEMKPKEGIIFQLKAKFIRPSNPRRDTNIRQWGGKHKITTIDQSSNVMTVMWSHQDEIKNYTYALDHFNSIKSSFKEVKSKDFSHLNRKVKALRSSIASEVPINDPSLSS